MAAFSFDFISAKDGRRLRTAIFQAEKPRGDTIVLLNGQSEFIEKYLEVIRDLNVRGFAVVTFDWRGQGGSARGLADPLKGYVGDFSEYDDDLVSFMDQVVGKLTSRPPLVLAHSMGGHMALRALHDHPEMFHAAVLVAPMLGIASRGYPVGMVRTITSLQTLFGKDKKFAWGMAKRDPLKVDFTGQLCTSDMIRFERTQTILKDYPELRIGGPTWGWIEAAYRSMKAQQKKGYAEAIKVPVLIFGAGNDRIVETEAVSRFAARMPKGLYVEIAGAEHEILMERNEFRDRFWKEFDAFTAS